MLPKIFSVISLFIIPVAVLIIPLEAQSDPADPEEVAHMKAGHKKVEGVVTELKSGLIVVKTPTGATLTLTENTAARLGRAVPKVGDEMTSGSTKATWSWMPVRKDNQARVLVSLPVRSYRLIMASPR